MPDMARAQPGVLPETWQRSMRRGGRPVQGICCMQGRSDDQVTEKVDVFSFGICLWERIWTLGQQARACFVLPWRHPKQCSTLACPCFAGQTTPALDPEASMMGLKMAAGLPGPCAASDLHWRHQRHAAPHTAARRAACMVGIFGSPESSQLLRVRGLAPLVCCV